MKVTPFNEAPHAPYELGKVPAAGWFAVEPTCEWQPKMQDELRRALNDPSDTVYQARLDAQGLMILEDNFSLEDTDGRGLPTSEQHKFEKAYGWVKALHAEGDMLWAWIEWTPRGHQAVNEGEYVFFSTEYDYPDFEVIDTRVVAPVRLAGLSVTNYPNHRGQLPMTNSRKPSNRENQQDKNMKPTNKTRTAITKLRDKNSELDQTPDEPTEEQTPPTPPAKEDNKPADTNSETDPDDPDKNKDTNDDGSAAVDILMQLAAEMDLDESANAEDVLAAVQGLKSKVEELTAALAAANASGGPDTNSRRRRYPNLAPLRDVNTRMQGQKPNRDVSVRINGMRRDVNTQQKAMTDYCQGRVDKEEHKLGRQLNSAEYARVWRDARQDYQDGQR